MSKLGEEQRLLLEEREKDMREMTFSAFREWLESVATFLDEKAHPTTREALGRAEDADDLGRVIPSANTAASRPARTAARTARRIHRHAANQQCQAEEEGYLMDGELPPADADDCRIAMGKLFADVKTIMEDVKAEAFRDASAGVGKWFGEWRAKFDEVYRGAWGGLGMVSAWEFWAHLEILGWNPLERPPSLDSFKGYSALYKYLRPSIDADEDEDDEPELGPDGDLVSAIISTALIPRIVASLRAARSTHTPRPMCAVISTSPSRSRPPSTSNSPHTCGSYVLPTAVAALCVAL
ncbi:GC-rich sequence DNA-binding factor 2 [Trametes pubescens]|uniref:GC-rich sequence DNA-binding factor 2 n=1 Tax=Trametes pubescens TaxID=154538 RepID=A0A1M2W5C1_TRAPU|nr:GC-rich sequence DNA-binding factor 2 [Trametes pubescens]